MEKPQDKTYANNRPSPQGSQQHASAGSRGQKGQHGKGCEETSRRDRHGPSPESGSRANAMTTPTPRPRALPRRGDSQRPPSVAKGVLLEDFFTVSNNLLFPVMTSLGHNSRPLRSESSAAGIAGHRAVGPRALPDVAAAVTMALPAPSPPERVPPALLETPNDRGNECPTKPNAEEESDLRGVGDEMNETNTAGLRLPASPGATREGWEGARSMPSRPPWWHGCWDQSPSS